MKLLDDVTGFTGSINSQNAVTFFVKPDSVSVV